MRTRARFQAEMNAFSSNIIPFGGKSKPEMGNFGVFLRKFRANGAMETGFSESALDFGAAGCIFVETKRANMKQPV